MFGTKISQEKNSLLNENLYWQSNEPIGGVEEKDFKIASIEIKYPKVEKFIYPIYCPKYTQYYSLTHKAIDIINYGCDDSSILAVGDGKVLLNEWISGYGNRIEIDNGKGIITSYSHLKLSLVKVGDNVLKGQKIGVMGSTGNSTGNHLHFEVILNGVKVNPKNFLINL